MQDYNVIFKTAYWERVAQTTQKQPFDQLVGLDTNRCNFL